MNSTTLTRRQILAVFRRHGYTQAQFAKDYGVFPSSVSQFFKGGVSEPMYKAALEKAQEFLTSEESAGAEKRSA